MIFARFNQDCSTLAIGADIGFSLYNCDLFGPTYSFNGGGVGIVEMLFSTSLVAAVGSGEHPSFSPRMLRIIHTKKNAVISELCFETAVLDVRMNRRCLIVVLEGSIMVYDITRMQLQHTIEINRSPFAAVVALSSSDSEYCHLAHATLFTSAPPRGSNSLPIGTGQQHAPTPLSAKSFDATWTEQRAPSTAMGNSLPSAASQFVGSITLFSIDQKMPVALVQAHRTALAALEFSPSGRLLASASVQGTLLRVFSVPSGAELYQFRRGTNSTRIHGLAFHATEQLLAVTSQKPTVHLFRLSETSAENIASSVRDESNNSFINDGNWEDEEKGLGLIGFASNMWSKRRSLCAYLPGSLVNTVIAPVPRCFAYARVAANTTGTPEAVGAVGFGFGVDSRKLYVVTPGGELHQFEVDFERGGECTAMSCEVLVPAK